jgi:hypothetical protein
MNMNHSSMITDTDLKNNLNLTFVVHCNIICAGEMGGKFSKHRSRDQTHYCGPKLDVT